MDAVAWWQMVYEILASHPQTAEPLFPGGVGDTCYLGKRGGAVERARDWTWPALSKYCDVRFNDGVVMICRRDELTLNAQED